MKLRTQRWRAWVSGLALLSLAPICDSDDGDGSNTPPPMVGPTSPLIPPDLLPGGVPPPPTPAPQAPYTGQMGCRTVGAQGAWLNASLPILLSACSRNMQVQVPFGVWNSRSTAPLAFGSGFNLAFEQTLEV